MATRKTTSTRRVVEDDDEIPLARGKVTVPKKRVVSKKPPPAAKKTTRRDRTRQQFSSGLDDAIDEMDGAHVPDRNENGNFEMEGLPQTSRRSRELEAQMTARLSRLPVFPFPPELDEKLKPYWTELVNSFPKDHFQVSDTTLMKLYCQCAYDIDRQNVKIEEEGEVVLGARGQAITNPRCKVRESNRGTLLALATKFRNQPASRVASNGFKTRNKKAQQAANGAQAISDDDDGLLAGGGEAAFEDDEYPPTRH